MNSHFLNEICAKSPAGASTLLRAYEYATDVKRSELDFAVEANRLMEMGLNECDLRWLVCHGLALHAVETTADAYPPRQFLVGESLRIMPRSCFALTPAGYADFCQCGDADSQKATTNQQDERVLGSDDVLCSERRSMGPYPHSDHPSDCSPLDFARRPEKRVNGEPAEATDALARPFWCSDRKELRINGTIVKQFRVPSPNQMTVLAVFEEEGWPTRIDDPLPSSSEVAPKRRLQDTIKSLNRNQQNQLIRFRGDGSGEGVVWELHRTILGHGT